MKTRTTTIPQAGNSAAPRDGAQSQIHAAAFASWRSQRGMLADKLRMQRFEEAIKVQVRSGMHVIDVGSGSGILALLAARAGAAQVYALEATPIIHDARRLAEANGLGDRIRFIEGDAAAFDGAKAVDLVIAECAGMFWFEEWRHFDAFARVRDSCLRPGGLVMPSKAKLFLCPVDDSRLYVERGPGFWERPVGGFDFSLVHEQGLDRVRRIIVQADSRTLLQPVEILTVDCLTADSRAFFFEQRHEIRLRTSATCHGFVGWFQLELAPGIFIDTSPLSIDTHWHQSYFPIEQIQLDARDALTLIARSLPDAETGSPVLELHVAHRRGERTLSTQERRYTLDDTQG